jgi:hypothetical protein
VVLVLHGDYGSGNGNITAGLFGVKVGHGIAVGVLAHTHDGAGHIKQALSQSGLAAAAVAQQNNISDRVNGIHDENFLLSGRLLPSIPFPRCQNTGTKDIIHESFEKRNGFFVKIVNL